MIKSLEEKKVARHLGSLACVGNGAHVENSISKILMALAWQQDGTQYLQVISWRANTPGNERSRFSICLRHP